MRNPRLRALAGACCVFATACAGARPSAKTVGEGLDAMTPIQRMQMLEATTGALDTRPRYVDELYAVARQHPRTFNRVLVNTTKDLRLAENARRTAEFMARDPDAFEQMMITTLEVIEHDPVARARLTSALVQKRAIVADVLTDDPDALVPIMNAAMRQTRRKARARAALRSSLEQSAKAVAPVLIEDPETLAVLMKALVEAGLNVDDAIAALKQPGAPDDENEQQADEQQRPAGDKRQAPQSGAKPSDDDKEP